MKKRLLIDILLQIIPVMIGVYLGFLVTSWGENSKLHRQRNQLITNLISEIQLNKKNVEAVLDYHKTLRDSSGFYAFGPHVMSSKPAFFKGTRMEALPGSAFKTGVQTGLINELPIDLIQDLNQLYTYQDAYNEYGMVLLTGLININFTGSEQNLQQIARFLNMTMTDVVIKEEILLQMYDELEVALAD